MKEFRTIVEVPPAVNRIGYQNPCLLMGSCFAENIGTRMERYKFPVLVNPFGVLYNPASIANSIELILKRVRLEARDLVFHAGSWHSFFHHSDFSCSDQGEALEAMNQAIEKAGEFLKKVSCIVISLGTARVYLHKTSGIIVSNCHKIPAAEFERKLLKVEEIVVLLEKMINDIKKVNNHCRFIFTLSPIRHWKDGAAGNQLSKSILLVSIHELLHRVNDAAYFPSYEIVMDDLRDYRFYDRDMIHLAPATLDYIWEKFLHSRISPEALPVIRDLEKLRLALEHKPFRPGSPEHRKFIDKNLEFIRTLSLKYPWMDLTAEQAGFLK